VGFEETRRTPFCFVFLQPTYFVKGHRPQCNWYAHKCVLTTPYGFDKGRLTLLVDVANSCGTDPFRQTMIFLGTTNTPVIRCALAGDNALQNRRSTLAWYPVLRVIFSVSRAVAPCHYQSSFALVHAWPPKILPATSNMCTPFR